MSSSLGTIFKVTTFGESHGIALGCIIENCPAGLNLLEADIQKELDRRRPGQSKISTPRSEDDKVSIVSGTFHNKTIGSPITMIVYNGNANEKDYVDFKDVYRPSHADYTYQAKYGYRTWLGGGRASARTTIGIVAAGAVAKKILLEKKNIQICAYVSQIKDLALDKNFKLPKIEDLIIDIEKNPVRCPDQKLADQMYRLIQDTRQQGDSLGGIIDLKIEGVPAGIGSPTFNRLDALLSQVMMSIPATKAVSIGSGFDCINYLGSEHNDIFYSENNTIRTRTNYSGGIQGGISNGEPIEMKIAFKPTATISKEQATVNESGDEIMLKVKGRHDPCVLPRAVPIVEALAAIVLVDQYLLSQVCSFDKLQ